MSLRIEREPSCGKNETGGRRSSTKGADGGMDFAGFVEGRRSGHQGSQNGHIGKRRLELLASDGPMDRCFAVSYTMIAVMALMEVEICERVERSREVQDYA